MNPSPDSPRGSSPAYSSPADQSPRSAKLAVTVFPLLIISGAAIALLAPATFTPLGAGVTYALMVIMFGMGLTLTLPDFLLVIKRPLPILAGVAFQFGFMPLLAFGIAWALQLPPALAAGLILVGSVPGGTSSNVVTYLARGDVALSVTMTSISTLLSPLLTPLLALWLAGQYLPVPAGDMAWDIVRIVLIPVIGGLVLRLLLPKLVQAVQPALPWISVLGITYVVVAVVSGSHEVLASAGALLLLGVVLHNLLGYGVGYGAAMLTRAPVPTRRAISVEVGMQNSGLAAGLGGTHFSAEAALPGAIFSVWHNISGGLLASFWGARRPKDQTEDGDAATPVAT
ncbi:bile acid:sodium symporter family protein [Nesterenkonia alkaliphila]|uniref:Bile acid:sodium symporter family protein n=1 Tax=Nesterenkonia alkaliphila TaxID=1463631 RepID=A0A7K1UN62_9MICC|nr:bile acid:sodium symporter family protein [Nesterenkonia alkaliphila]MVT27732.1 bile acid:sodium symporter family protein [Nesterenkonia alkaliphila]GFZ87593.1 Na+-dependent transporter [Nesterenkonia alkaliphila]